VRRRANPAAAAGRRGFTLIELLVVIAIIALASGLVALSIRDPAAAKLDQEAARLSALLESARAEARASGLAARWLPTGDAEAEIGTGFRFVGLPARLNLPQHWLEPEVRADIVGARAVTLGPEPFIGAQTIVLQLSDRRITLATDGLGPFTVVADDAAATPARP
jgi:general secretion pathway protein H